MPPRTRQDEAAAANDRGKTFLFSGRFAEATVEFEQALKLDPSNAVTAINLATSYFQEGRLAKALEIAQPWFEKVTDDLRRRRLIALLAGTILDECAAQRVVCGTPLTDDEIARLDAQGEDLIKARRFEGATVVFLRAYAFSGKPRSLLRVAGVEYLAKNYTEALKDAERVREIAHGASANLSKEAEALIATIRKDVRMPELAPPSTDPNVDPVTAAERLAWLDNSNTRNALLLAATYRANKREHMAIYTAQRVLTMPNADRAATIEAAIIAGETIQHCIDDRVQQCIKDPLLTTAEIERLDKEGQALVQARRSDEALPIFLRAYAYSGDPRPLLRIATFEYVTGHYTDALEHAKRVRVAVPEKTSDLRKEAEELIRVIEADCRQKKANCTAK